MEDSIQKAISQAEDIVIVQADNPDGDSLASALALDEIFSSAGKKVHLYCGTNVPTYLRYLDGWDRVQDMLPVKFDVSVIVDTGAVALLEQLQKTGSLGWLKSKPCIVLDHHTEAETTIDFASVTYIKNAVSTGELIYELAQKLSWSLNRAANQMILASIMSDSLGLTSDRTTPRTIRIVAELAEAGAGIPKLENARRSLQKKSPELLKYKAELIKRVEYSPDQRIATVTIPWEEIEKYSHEYNPSVLVLDEMRMVSKVELAVAFKTYPNGRITAKLRANYGYPVAAELADSFGGGGHSYAAGFKITENKTLNEIKAECIKRAEKLLDTLKKDDDETIQYAYTVS